MVLRRAATATACVAVLLVAAFGADRGLANPRHRVMYVIGDSWSAGLHADPERTLAQDAAADLGMTPVVDAESGTGYLTAPGGTRTYAQRAATIPASARADLVVIQGGSNDDGRDAAALEAAVARTVASVRAAFPEGHVVLLGPGPDPWPVTAEQTAVDAALQHEAAALGVAYISPMQEGWFTASNVASIISPSTAHPTVAGDRVLGQRLAQDLLALRSTARR